ncbi:MAG: HTTM domain-containing protein [Cyanobacteria bacterium SZAS LIN-3]|nr:HTTM domain-containing protein [Cyanobacteria bacterium SZAS LIN-3]
MTIGSLWNVWRKFWFEPTGTSTIAVYRILYGILVLQVAVVHLGGHFEEWYGAKSMVTLPTVVNHFWFNEPRFDLFLLFPQTDASFLMVYAVFVLAALCLCLGLFSKYSALAVWLILLSMHHQNPYNINGGDAFLRSVAPFLALSHCGDRFSLDALIARKRGRAPTGLANPWAQRMIQVQIALVYWQTFCCKVSGEQWLDGTAVYYATRLDDMIRFPAPFITDNMLILKALDYFTLVIEFLAWNAIFIKEFRYYILAGLLFLHLGIDYLINLPVFEWAFIFTLVTFVEPADLDAVFLFLREKLRVWRHGAADKAVTPVITS